MVSKPSLHSTKDNVGTHKLVGEAWWEGFGVKGKVYDGEKRVSSDQSTREKEGHC